MIEKYKLKFKLIDNGIVFMLLSAFISTLSGAVAKVLSHSMSPMEIVFYRNLLGMIIILYSLKNYKAAFDTSKIHVLLLRGLFGTFAMLLFFHTVSTIPLGEAVILNKTSPFFVTILAYYFMKESISIYTIFAVLIGFIGVLFIVQPLGVQISIEHIYGVLGGFFAAAAYATIKKIKDIYDARIIMLSFTSIGVVLPFLLYLFTPYVQFHIHYDIFIWALIVLMSILSTLSQWFLTRAYSLSRASVIGVVSYSSIPFAVGFGLMLGDDIPDMYTFLGIGLIAIGGILVSKK